MADFEGATDFVPRYDLTGDEVTEVTQDYLAGTDPAEGRFLTVEVGSEGDLSNVARNTERVVFEPVFQNDAAQMLEEYGPYETGSSFLLTLDAKTGQPAGVVRMIAETGSGLKSVNDLDEVLGISPEEYKSRQDIDDFNKTVDFGTLAVTPDYRGKLIGHTVSTGLLRGFFLTNERDQTEHVVTVIDSRARRGPDLLGIPLREVEGTGPFEYMGSKESYALHGRFPGFEAAVVARAEELKNEARFKASDIIHPTDYIRRQATAKFSGMLATGRGLDPDIRLLGN